MLANRITVGRIVLVPLVVGLLLVYSRSLKSGLPIEAYRWAALGVFLLAAVSDVADGYVARHYHEQSKLGAILDPLADKFLLISTIATMTFMPWEWSFPVWFLILVVARDLLAISGAILVHRLTGDVEMKTHWFGKAATFLQICSVCWVMLQVQTPNPLWAVGLASLFTVLSALVYLREAIRQISTKTPKNSNPETS